ncbi:MAG: RAD52 family DNA repair protein, partial [Cyanobium sp.]
VNYLQGWVLIEEANRIFGHDGWQRQTLSCQCATEAKRLIGSKSEGRPQKEGWGVPYFARVRITMYAGERGLLIREGTGAGHGIDVDLGLAHESAIKEAETDAMKRALVTFGNPFGLALYDRSQRQVSGAQAPQAGHPPAQAANGAMRRPQAAASVAQAPTVSTPHAPLDPPTIRSLQDRIRGLLPPQLAAFSRAFRSAFQVPESTPSIAGLITKQRHRAWILQYLAQGLGQTQARTA